MARYRKDLPKTLNLTVQFEGTSMGTQHTQGTINPANRTQVQKAIQETIIAYIKIIKLNPNQYNKNTFYLDMIRKLNDANDNETNKNVFDFDDITYIWRTNSTHEHAQPFKTAPQDVKERIAIATQMSIEEIQNKLDNYTSDEQDEEIWSKFEEPKFPFGYFIDNENKKGFIDFFPNRGIEIYSPNKQITLTINDFGDIPEGYNTEAVNLLYQGWEMCRYTNQYDIKYWNDLYENTQPYTAKEIFQTFSENAEQLMTVLSITNAEDIFSELDAQILDAQTITKTQTRTFVNSELNKKENKIIETNNLTEDMFEQKLVTYQDTYQLIKLDGNIFTKNLNNHDNLTQESRNPVYAVKCNCTSTNRQFTLYVENQVAERNFDAIECIASTLYMKNENGQDVQLTKEQYLAIEAEA